MVNRDYKHYMVWTGCAWWPTWAVSEKKAISNVEYRMRKCGKFPQGSQFEVRLANQPSGQGRREATAR